VIEVYTLSTNPDAISVGVSTLIAFTISHAGTTSPASVYLRELNDVGEEARILGELRDDGEGEGIIAGDFVYTGSFSLGPYAEECTVPFRAHLEWSGGLATTSDIFSLAVTEFPIGHTPFDSSKVVVDPVTRESIVGDEVLIGIREGTSPERVREIVAAVDGEVIGEIYHWDNYQVRIPFTQDGSGVYEAIAVLEGYDEVEYAEPSAITSIDTFLGL